RRKQGDEEEIVLQPRRLRPSAGERDREQEREQHLYAGQGDPELVQQLDQLPVDAFLRVLVRHQGAYARRGEWVDLGVCCAFQPPVFYLSLTLWEAGSGVPAADDELDGEERTGRAPTG